jgi:hypothetical protein
LFDCCRRRIWGSRTNLRHWNELIILINNTILFKHLSKWHHLLLHVLCLKTVWLQSAHVNKWINNEVNNHVWNADDIYFKDLYFSGYIVVTRLDIHSNWVMNKLVMNIRKHQEVVDDTKMSLQSRLLILIFAVGLDTFTATGALLKIIPTF